MKQILDRIEADRPKSDKSEESDILNYYKKQFDKEIRLSEDPNWIFALLSHFRAHEQSSLKSLCEAHPEMANQLLSYLDNRYKYSQIIRQGLHKPMHSLRLLKQRLEFSTDGYNPLAHELLNVYFETWRARQAYHAHQRSNTLLSKVALFVYRFLSTLIAAVLLISSIPFALYLAMAGNILLSQIEWGLLDLASGGNYTKNLKNLPLDNERLFLRLCDGLEEERYPNINTLDNAEKNYVASQKRWPEPVNQKDVVPNSERKRVWGRHLMFIYREQDAGITHLSLIIKTFHNLTTASLKSSFFGLQGLEIFFRLRYILLGLTFLTLAIGIQSLTEYLPNIVMSVLVTASLALDLCLSYLLVTPFCKEATFQLALPKQQYLDVTSPVKMEPPAQPSYFFKRCSEVNARLLEDKALLTTSPMPANM